MSSLKGLRFHLLASGRGAPCQGCWPRPGTREPVTRGAAGPFQAASLGPRADVVRTGRSLRLDDTRLPGRWGQACSPAPGRSIRGTRTAGLSCPSRESLSVLPGDLLTATLVRAAKASAQETAGRRSPESCLPLRSCRGELHTPRAAAGPSSSRAWLAGRAPRWCRWVRARPRLTAQSSTPGVSALTGSRPTPKSSAPQSPPQCLSPRRSLSRRPAATHPGVTPQHCPLLSRTS